MNKRDIENTLTVFKREFLAYFNSPVLYVIVRRLFPGKSSV